MFQFSQVRLEKSVFSRSSQTFGVLLNSELTTLFPLHPRIRSRHPLTFAEHCFKQVFEAENRL